ncbi:bath-40, partial [Symbiodinium sp. KB8]
VETIASSVKTLKNLAFISSYSPGQADDAPLMEVERSEEVQVRTLTQPERAERYEKQVKRLSGVNIKGSSEPSERLVDVCVAIYERNQLQYVPWSRCSSREQEAQNESRKEVKLALDGSGKVKVDSASKEVVADTSTEVLVMQALQRRALAMEQANIVSYTLLDLWHQRLMKARLTDPPPGYSRPSFDQLRLADQKLFSELQDGTRSGIQALSSGRPVDNLIKDVMHRAEVSSLLLPLPASSVASVAKSTATAPPPQPTWKGNGKGKGKTKGKTGRMGTPRMPAELEGCKAYTQKGIAQLRVAGMQWCACCLFVPEEVLASLGFNLDIEPIGQSERYPQGFPWLSGTWRDKVESANLIYLQMARFCEWLSSLNISWSVENPERSYMWLLPEWKHLRSQCLDVVFDSCMWGSCRKKSTRFLTTCVEMLSLAKTCDNKHSHASWQPIKNKFGVQYATSQEAAYPHELCQAMSSALQLQAASFNLEVIRECPLQQSSHAAAASARRQPKLSKYKPLLEDFKYRVTVAVDSVELLILEIVASLLSSSPVDILRLMKIAFMRVLNQVAASLGWPDEALHDELVRGFRITGLQDASGVFGLDPRPALWAKIKGAPLDSLGRELWDITYAEYRDKSWLEEPRTFSQLEQLMPEGWVPTRRFPVVQHDKLRPIDDLTECGTNGACSTSTLDKLDLRALDETVFTAMLIMRCLESRCFALRLDDGRILRGRVHPYWLQHPGPDRARVLVKTVDLKSAYKQLALHPDDRRFSVISLKDPADDEPKGFLCRVLPFASVGHFNRVARLVQRIFHEMKLLAANYFDDYPLLEVAELSQNADRCAKAVLDLFGFTWAKDKDEAFSPCTDLLGVRLATSTSGPAAVTLSNKPSRVEDLRNAIDKVVSDGVLKPCEAASVFGRLQFAETQLLGRAGRLAMADIRWIERAHHDVKLDDLDKNVFRMLASRVASGKPRVLTASTSAARALVFTDGACEGEEGIQQLTIGAVLYFWTGRAWLTRWFSGFVPAELASSWRAAGIGPTELYAVIVARHVWSRFLDNTRSMFFIDHAGVLSSCIKGTSRDSEWRKLLLAFEKIDASSPSLTWCARVPSQSNPSDSPSRGSSDFPTFGSVTCDEASCPIAKCSLRAVVSEVGEKGVVP